MYIWVEKRLGTLGGVTQRVKGIRLSVSGIAPHFSSKSVNLMLPECTA